MGSIDTSVVRDFRRSFGSRTRARYLGGLVGTALILSPSIGSSQQEEVRFETTMPVEFACVPASGCRIENNKLHLDIGATLQYGGANLSGISYDFVSSMPSIAPQLGVTTKSTTCAAAGSPVASQFTQTSGSVTLKYDSYGAVCVALSVLPASPSAVLISGVGVVRMTPEEVSSKIMIERIQANLIDPLRTEIIITNKTAVITRLNELEDDVNRELELASARFQRSRDINFESELSLAVGEVNNTANPMSYKQFSDLLQMLNQELVADPVGKQYLGTLQEELQTPPNRLRSILGAGAQVVQGLLSSSGFGTVANGLRALFASTFSAPAVASRQGQTGLVLRSGTDPSRGVKFNDLATLAVQLTAPSQAAVTQKLTTGASTFQQLDSLLKTLDRANADVNVITDRLSEVARVSAANEAGYLSTFENLLRSVSVSCAPSSCRGIASSMLTEPTRNSIRTKVSAYFDRQIAEVNGMTPSTLAQYSVGLASFDTGVKQLTSGGDTRYDLMVSTYRSFFETLQSYLSAQNNPFGTPSATCLGTGAHASPACEWENLAATARTRIRGIYPSKFDEKYPPLRS